MVLKLFEYVYVQHLFCKLHNNYFWAKWVVGIRWTLGWIRINGGLPWFKTRFYDSLFWYMSIHCWTEVLGLSGMELILFLVFYGGVFWICNWNSVDNTPVFWLLLSNACTASRILFLLVCHPVSQGWARSW